MVMVQPRDASFIPLFPSLNSGTKVGQSQHAGIGIRIKNYDYFIP